MLEYQERGTHCTEEDHEEKEQMSEVVAGLICLAKPTAAAVLAVGFRRKTSHMENAATPTKASIPRHHHQSGLP
jgi:hypothetical protein